MSLAGRTVDVNSSRSGDGHEVTEEVVVLPAPRKYPNELRERVMRLVKEAREQAPKMSRKAVVVGTGIELATLNPSADQLAPTAASCATARSSSRTFIDSRSTRGHNFVLGRTSPVTDRGRFTRLWLRKAGRRWLAPTSVWMSYCGHNDKDTLNPRPLAADRAKSWWSASCACWPVWTTCTRRSGLCLAAWCWGRAPE